MRKLIDWLAGWYTMLIIKYRNPGLYEFLCQEFDRENFVEVQHPSGINLLIHKDAVETLRKLGEENS